MKKLLSSRSVLLVFSILALIGQSANSAEKQVAPAPNGIRIPEGYKDWKMISSSHRTDNQTLRIILGNKIAVKAARDGKTKPWPDGAILAKIVWKDSQHPLWQSATVPGALLHTEFMLKDSKKYATTKGWGFARWKGLKQQPYGDDASFAHECLTCHAPAKGNDYVFTQPASFP
jgi:hypothetical protein